MPGSDRSGIVRTGSIAALLAAVPCLLLNRTTAAEPTVPTDPARLIAMVGEQPVLLADVQPKVDQFLAQLEARQPIPEDQRELLRERVVRKALAETIQIKMLYQAFIRQLVQNRPAAEAEDMEQQIRTRARKVFYEEELPSLLEKLELSGLPELDAKLRESGSSLEQREREFIESMVGQMYVQQEIPRKPEIAAAEMLAYYREHAAQYDRPARARWEQLSIHFSRSQGRAAAYRAIREMGAEAYFGGSMQAVAKEKSHGPLAEQGGVHDWTSQGSLVSKVLDEAIFSLPIGEMSPVLEDATGLHIVRVLERKEAGRVPFSEVQDEIRAQLQQEKRKQLQEEFLAEMRAQVPVWSLFPEDVEKAHPLERVAQGPEETGAARRR